jgi:hypothetical protein
MSSMLGEFLRKTDIAFFLLLIETGDSQATVLPAWFK